MQVSHFLNWARHERDYSAHTVGAYERDLQQFSDFLTHQYEVDTPGAVTRPMVRSWLAELALKRLSPSSLSRKLSSVNAFFKYLLRQDVVKANPAAGLTVPKKGLRLPTVAPKDQLLEALEALALEEGFEALRNRLVVELLYATGMRRGELLSLKDEDFAHGLEEVRVLGKGRKQRVIPIAAGLRPLIRQYLKAKREEGITTASFVVTAKGKHAYPMLIHRIVEAFLIRLGTVQKVSPHILRHTFATHLLNQGAALTDIKELLGHASLSATEIYTHVSVKELKEAYQGAHPRAKKKHQ